MSFEMIMEHIMSPTGAHAEEEKWVFPGHTQLSIQKAAFHLLSWQIGH